MSQSKLLVNELLKVNHPYLRKVCAFDNLQGV